MKGTSAHFYDHAGNPFFQRGRWSSCNWCWRFCCVFRLWDDIRHLLCDPKFVMIWSRSQWNQKLFINSPQRFILIRWSIHSFDDLARMVTMNRSIVHVQGGEGVVEVLNNLFRLLLTNPMVSSIDWVVSFASYICRWIAFPRLFEGIKRFSAVVIFRLKAANLSSENLMFNVAR